jgi:hypothetical protein
VITDLLRSGCRFDELAALFPCPEAADCYLRQALRKGEVVRDGALFALPKPSEPQMMTCDECEQVKSAGVCATNAKGWTVCAACRHKDSEGQRECVQCGQTQSLVKFQKWPKGRSLICNSCRHKRFGLDGAQECSVCKRTKPLHLFPATFRQKRDRRLTIIPAVCVKCCTRKKHGKTLSKRYEP